MEYYEGHINKITLGMKFSNKTLVLVITMATPGIANIMLTSSPRTVNVGTVRATVKATMYTEAAIYLPVDQIYEQWKHIGTKYDSSKTYVSPLVQSNN